ncbi:MAG: FAD binding domain-containing protein [Meiothermus sp.]|nr:FAD binding domain-containing protein [Meiothermus sp.]
MSGFSFKLNGKQVEVGGQDPHTTLLSWLRQSGLTGSKEGCAEGECGACAVLLLRPDGAGSRYESVNGCLVLLPSVAGLEVWTVEGLAQNGELHPAQRAMLQGGSQCGYCTPGFVVSMAAEFYRKDREGFDLEALSGNLCRCTGYRPIKDAADSLGKPGGDDVLARRLEQPAPTPHNLDYTADPVGAGPPPAQAPQFHRPVALPQVFDLLARFPTAKLVAGGTDWVVEVNQRYSRAPVQVDLSQVPELRGLSWADDELEIGAGLTLSEVEHRLAGRVPLLHQLLPLFASRLIRNRATLGGNIGTASPIGDSPPALLALGASLVLASAAGERVVELDKFFVGYRRTVLEPGELIKSVRVPLPLMTEARFYKVAKRHVDDISTVAMGVAMRRGRGGAVEAIRIGLGGVAATPVRAYKAEAALLGQPWDARAVGRAAEVIRAEFRPIDDHRGSAAYRTAMLGSLLEKFYAETSEVRA